jgi:hypothetical protein
MLATFPMESLNIRMSKGVVFNKKDICTGVVLRLHRLT